MFFITGMSTFTWILVAYVGLYLGHDYIGFLKGQNFSEVLNFTVYTHHMGSKAFVVRLSELFLIVGSLALFIEVSKAATTKNFSGTETLLSFLISVVFVILFFMVPWAQNATFLILTLMSFIDATGGFVIELNAAQRDFHIG